MKISEILQLNRIIPELKGKEKDSIIDELLDQFKDDERINDLKKIRDAVFEREKIMSTGVGKGFAIPHAKTDAVKEIVAGFGKLKEPVDFEALDGEPVNLVFLLIGKENLVGPHIKLLSRISRMMNKDEFREKLMTAGTQEEILHVFTEEEKKYFDLP